MAARKRATATAERQPSRVEQAVPLSSLTYYPGNPRRGDVDALKRLMKRRGWWGAVVVQMSSSTILAGNHRLRARSELAADLAADPELATRERWHPDAAGTDAPIVHVLDVNDAEASEIVAGDNRASDMAHNDPFDLHALLAPLDDDALLALSYTPDDVAALVAQANPPSLDALRKRDGDFTDKDGEAFWPKVTLQISPLTLDRLNDYRLTLGEVSDDELVRALLDATRS